LLTMEHTSLDDGEREYLGQHQNHFGSEHEAGGQP
jgi:hypothetical protein